MSRVASVLSEEDNERAAPPIDQLLCCSAGQTNQWRHNRQCVSPSCRLGLTSNLTPIAMATFNGALMNSSSSRWFFCCGGKMMTLMNLRKPWASSVCGRRKKILIDFGEVVKFTRARRQDKLTRRYQTVVYLRLWNYSSAKTSLISYSLWGQHFPSATLMCSWCVCSFLHAQVLWKCTTGHSVFKSALITEGECFPNA